MVMTTTSLQVTEDIKYLRRGAGILAPLSELISEGGKASNMNKGEMVMIVFKTVQDFTEVVRRNYLKLVDVEDCLNDKGIAKMRAFKEIYTLTGFADDFKDLALLTEDIELKEDDHPEYLKNMKRMIKIINDCALGGNKNV